MDILTVDGKCYEQMSTLNKIIVHLPSEFIRTHRSYIVNMAHIYRITSGTIELSNHLTTQIARSYSKDVISALPNIQQDLIQAGILNDYEVGYIYC